MLDLKSTQDKTSIINLPTFNLPTEDGIPLETNWHRIQMNLLIDILFYYWRDRTDYFMGGNMFIYYSANQVRNEDYRGPDFFLVKDVDGSYDRDSWIIWEEDGRYPNLIIELASPSTINTDLNFKKHLYEKTFRTPEYFCYDPKEKKLLGWRLSNNQYHVLQANDKGWLWCEEVDLWLGLWKGKYQGINRTWLRFYNADGVLIYTGLETEAQRAEAEAQRANAAEEKAKHLAALLAEHGITVK